MTIRVTITKPGVTDAHGIAMVVGTTYTVEDAFGLSLIQQGRASDTDDTLGQRVNAPFDEIVLPVNPAGLSDNEPAFSSADRKILASTASLSRNSVRNMSKPFANAGFLGYTGHTNLIVPTGYYAARLVAENICATASVNFAASLASSANTSGDGTTPTGTPVAFTWNTGSATVTLAAAVSGGGGVDVVPSITASDIVPIADIARTDGGLGRIVMVRDYLPAAGNTETSRVGGNDGPLATLGVICTSSNVAYNGATWPTLTSTIGGLARSWSLQLFTDLYARTLLLAGDSTMQGALLGNEAICPAQLAALELLASSSGSFFVVNRGSASQTSDVFFTNGVNYMAAVPVTAAAFCPFSPNDSDKYTTAGTLRQMSLAARWVAECRERGVLPILVTPDPVNGITVANETERRLVVTKVKAMAESMGLPCVDRDAIYTDYSSAAGGFKSGLNSNTVHPSSYGYSLEKVEWVRVMNQII